LDNIKAYASIRKTSISDLVENYFKRFTKPAKRKNMLTMVEKIEKTKIDSKSDLKELYYQDQSKKYGS